MSFSSRSNLSILAVAFFTLLAIITPTDRARSEVILQYFNTDWNEIAERMPELAEAGYSSLWLPPPFKAAGGTYSVGFDTFDRFDFGDKDQSGGVPTRYGTAADLLRLMEIAHRFGIRVYFDNVMAHNGGPLDKNTDPGELFPGIPGFLPEDFHIVREPDGTWRKAADWPDWNDEWQVLNRNPFAWDIAQELPENTSFNPTGTAEGANYPRWSGVRHPNNPEYYLDNDLDVATNGEGNPVHPFANKEPFEDNGLDQLPGTNDSGENNGRFDWTDSNGNGQHDLGEPGEIFTDGGVDSTNPARRTTDWGYGDNIYNMGDPVSEDVNQMLFRAVRWFIDQTNADGFRLDAVKHVPFAFFGKPDGADKDYVNWGYTGNIQEQFNITHGFSDWNNHRDTVYNTEFQARDDALLYGEHLGAPPQPGDYLDTGMRIASDDLLNAIKDIGANLGGWDQPGFSAFGAVNQSVDFIMSHDNNSLFGGDRPAGHMLTMLRQGTSIVYTDGYHQSGAPDYFPKPAENAFLGQFGDNSIIGPLSVHRDLARGYQEPKWSDADFLAFERIDERENKSNAPNWNGVTMLYLQARNYTGGQTRPVISSFPPGARLRNYSNHGGAFTIVVQGNGTIKDTGGGEVFVPSGGYFAFGWHQPRMPSVWGNSTDATIKPITILQNGVPVPMMPHVRMDGPDGDDDFNPYGLSDSPDDYRYTLNIPRVTDGSNLTILARADGSAESIRVKLDGGMDVNSHLGLGPTGSGDKRDFPPGINVNRSDPAVLADSNKQDSTETYEGYEQMSFKTRVAEKFAARSASRNIIGSLGAETYEATIGSTGFDINNGGGENTSTDTVRWIFHDPLQDNQLGSPQLQFFPAPQSATNQAITIWIKTGYEGEVDSAFLYYTTDGTSYPEGSIGVGKGSTQVVACSKEANGNHDGTGQTEWWTAQIPALPAGTVLRYKVGALDDVADSRFPWTDRDITLKSRMETQFEITSFDASTVDYFPHNNYGNKATGLKEGYHILRTRAFVRRNDGASIFNTKAQTFYYDTQRPAGTVLFPNENDTLGGSTYGCVVLSDESVTEVWYSIEDTDPGNDSASNGNGAGNWQMANRVSTPTQIKGTAYAKEWRFDYVNIPGAGAATIQVRFKEASSSGNMSLNDNDGWFTTVNRGVTTGSSINFHIGFPMEGDVVDDNYVMKVYFNKPLLPGGMLDQDFLDEVSISIASTESGSDANPVLQPRADYRLARDETATQHVIEYTFPNLYNGNPDFLHHVRVQHQRGSIIHSDTVLVKMLPGPLADVDMDGLPDTWEDSHGLSSSNPDGIFGGEGDHDGDGLSNFVEYLIGTSPILSDAHLFPVVDPSRNPSGDILLHFPVIAGRQYQVFHSSDLETWFPAGPPVMITQSAPDYLWTDDGTETGGDPQAQARRFYRVEISLP